MRTLDQSDQAVMADVLRREIAYDIERSRLRDADARRKLLLLRKIDSNFSQGEDMTPLGQALENAASQLTAADTTRKGHVAQIGTLTAQVAALTAANAALAGHAGDADDAKALAAYEALTGFRPSAVVAPAVAAAVKAVAAPVVSDTVAVPVGN